MTLDEARPLIEDGLSYTCGTHLFEDVAEMVAAGKLTFWSGPQSVCLTEVLQAPQKKILNVWLVAGKLDELQAMYPGIYAWARDVHGCQLVTHTGRPGWARSFLKQEGWKTQLVVMVKEI
ncbi:MAG: hypothetical protein K0S14_23 [Thermomicrobiales bacterium]|jgi:hypothetical protein|nr:hypothetical protein [Thermomicrobiales bacterium]